MSTSADRVRHNISQQPNISPLYLQWVVMSLVAIVRCESQNMKTRQAFRKVKFEERLNAEIEMQQAEQLLSEISIAYGSF